MDGEMVEAIGIDKKILGIYIYMGDSDAEIRKKLAKCEKEVAKYFNKNKLCEEEMVSLRGKMASLSADFSNFLKRYDLTLKNIIRKKSVKKSVKKSKKHVPLSPARARELSERFKRTLKERRLAREGLKDFLDRYRYDDSRASGNTLSAAAAKEWEAALNKVKRTRGLKGGRRRTRRRRRRRRRTRR